MPNTKHTRNGGFGPHFGRLDPSCPRCIELKMASKFAHVTCDEAPGYELQRPIKAHNCTRSNCGPVCTFGDW